MIELSSMHEISLAISEAARATTIDDLAMGAFPALARAIDACPVFLAESAANFVESQALAGEHRDEIPGYLRQYLAEDPVIRAGVAVPDAVSIPDHHVDQRAFRMSRAYNEFHRIRDFEHHFLVRFLGPHLLTPGALSMGFTRGRRLPGFGAREIRIAEHVLPALNGAAQRIVADRSKKMLDECASGLAADRGLTGAETRVLSVLLSGASNREIAARLYVSIDTVKTHLQRIFRKLGVTSRAQALAAVREAGRQGP
jgi:DNA-binding CsgD family transcriptional regulator